MKIKTRLLLILGTATVLVAFYVLSCALSISFIRLAILRNENQEALFWLGFLAAATVIYVVCKIALIVWGYRWVHSKVITPIESLEKGVQRISSGDLSGKIGLDTQDELGYLGRAFDKMTSRLVKYNEVLEKRVHQRTEELEKLNEELARSNHDLEQFAYVASHDLQEPLRSITNFADLLSINSAGKMDSESEVLLKYIQEASVRARQLIQELLAYGGIGVKPSRRQWTDLNSVLQRTLVNLQSAIETAEARISGDPLPSLEVDGVQAGRLFQNLISNAIKYRGTQSPCIHISAKRQNQEWVFSVKDNGIGIDPQYRDQIFKIFKRLHSRKEYPGNGIGLAICKRIVQCHGGNIWVESEPGKGSTFYFTLQPSVPFFKTLPAQANRRLTGVILRSDPAVFPSARRSD